MHTELNFFPNIEVGVSLKLDFTNFEYDWTRKFCIAEAMWHCPMLRLKGKNSHSVFLEENFAKSSHTRMEKKF